jgi:uncharacterized Zn finger protein (UPF0148 family)
MPAIPQLMTIKSSPRLNALRYGRTTRDHADEDVGGGGQPHCPADSQGLLEDSGDRPHDGRQHPPVEQQRGQRADHQDQGQRAKRQHEARGARPFLERLRAAAEKSEDEAGALLRRLLQRREQVIETEKQVPEQRDPEEQRSERELQQRAGNHDAPRHRAPVFGHQPGDRADGDEAEGALQG